MPQKDKGYIKAFEFLINTGHITTFAEKKKKQCAAIVQRMIKCNISKLFLMQYNIHNIYF